MSPGRNGAEGRHIVIIGAGGQLGRAVAMQAPTGSHLYLVDINAYRLDEALELTRRARHLTVHSRVLDTATTAGAKELGQWIRKRTPAVNQLVHAAGITGPIANAENYPPEEFDEVLRVNLKGPFLVLSTLLPLLREGTEAAAVLVGSTSSIRGRSGLGGYVASKHGLLGLIRTAALDLDPADVRINAVLPGPMAGPMIDDLNTRAHEQGASFRRASDRPTATAEPEDVAHVIEFLLSPQARHVHGAGWVVDAAGTVG